MTSDASIPTKAVPRMVGRYHLLEEVGKGTFGPLHLARFEGPNGFQRWTSVLEVELRFARDPEFKDAFFQSARTAARIQHANVVATLDVGETEGMLWLASEYLLGETAKDLLMAAQQAKMPIPWDIACRMMADAALGVDAIHELAHATNGTPMRLVHGRLAPHRLVVTYDGVTKVLEPSAPMVTLSAGEPGQAKTMVGRAVAYTAPELLRGEAFDRRADVFSLGAVLWELCAGRRLFGGRDESETRAKIQGNVIPPLSESVRGFPADVESLIRQALAPDPAARFITAKALARALHQVLVRDALVVTDDEVARYLSQLFPDRLARKKERLLTAADVTHVFNRSMLSLPSGAAAQSGPWPGAVAQAPRASDAGNAPSPRMPVRRLPPHILTSAQAAPPTPAPPADLASTTMRVRKLDPMGPTMLFVVLGIALAVVAVLIIVVVRRPSTTGPVAVATPHPPAPSVAPSPVPAASSAPSVSGTASASGGAIPILSPASVQEAASAARTAPRAATTPAAPPAPKGKLTVICDPACDDVLDGRVSLGPSPIYKRSTSLGTHHITLRVSDPSVEKVVDVVVHENDVTVLKQSMTP
ncbi:serine/threonine protein kinase [Pendulispora rubella]|uniref:non-specific serine/threonine protein kinase n=1 Tax=Pendulispora rubella TaxID=2741070 RepID=A0ABZ2L9N9_9BACT